MIGKLAMRMYFLSLLTTIAVSSGCGGGGGGSEEGEGPGLTSGKSPVISASDSFFSETLPYSLQVLDIPGRSGYAVDVNEFGEVAGNFLDEAGNIHAFSWKDGQTEVLAASAQVSAINRQGMVVGWLETPDGPEAFIHDGELFLLGPMDGVSKALDVNDLDQIVGRRTSLSEGSFLETNGWMQELAIDIEGYALSINNRGQILIKEIRDQGFGALLWENETAVDLGNLGGESTQARDLNDRGQVIGWSETAKGEYHAFLWEEGQMIDLTPPGFNFSSAVAINESGQILVKASAPEGDSSFLWENGEWIDLQNFGTEWITVSNLNDRGQIVGWLADEDGDIQGFLATPR